MTDQAQRFVEHLLALAERRDRAALAALRRGLGKDPGAAPDVYPHVVPWLPRHLRPFEEKVYYLVASLFATHPVHWATDGDGSTGLGASFARLRAKMDSSSIERRFVALLNAHPDDLPVHLRHAVGLLKSKEIPVDWIRLIRDLCHWEREDRRVQREWARAFWVQESS